MKVVWDEPKRLANLAKHGLDFAELNEFFFANSVITQGKAGRLIAVGRSISGDILVVFAMLGREAVSIVSMRYASRKERRLIDVQQKKQP